MFLVISKGFRLLERHFLKISKGSRLSER